LANEYEASVDWGDGQASREVIGPTGKGNFFVSARHIYNEEGHYAVVESFRARTRSAAPWLI